MGVRIASSSVKMAQTKHESPKKQTKKKNKKNKNKNKTAAAHETVLSISAIFVPDQCQSGTKYSETASISRAYALFSNARISAPLHSHPIIYLQSFLSHYYFIIKKKNLLFKCFCATYKSVSNFSVELDCAPLWMLFPFWFCVAFLYPSYPHFLKKKREHRVRKQRRPAPSKPPLTNHAEETVTSLLGQRYMLCSFLRSYLSTKQAIARY